MKVYAEVLPNTLGRAMYRVNKNIKKYAPDRIEFVDKADDADFQILDAIGKGSLEYIRHKNYVVLQHCYVTTETRSLDVWGDFWKNANLVCSYIDLPNLSKFNEFNFLRIPWGVDSNLFYRIAGTPKTYDFLTTGYVAETECIEQAVTAIKAEGKSMVHIGGNLHLNGIKRFENISDEQMRELYNRSRYTLGLRRLEGFELPIIEGTLCNSRGVCIDDPCYSYWYGNLVEYIADGDFDYITNQLRELLNKPYREVTEKEIQFVKEKFDWEVIMTKIWKRILV